MKGKGCLTFLKFRALVYEFIHDLEPSISLKTFLSYQPIFQLYEDDLRSVKPAVTLILKIQTSEVLFTGGIYGPCKLILSVNTFYETQKLTNFNSSSTLYNFYLS
uniref:Putative ovule protein n=1 Tax=Solanum chacoense TaxID=4108 RepID=A0A0V0GSL3_SOLCH